MANSRLRLGTRSSALARWQADWVTARLHEAGIQVEQVLITTSGDARTLEPIVKIGSPGAFTKEIQRALLDDRVDLAVHSLKDLPTDEVPGLTLAAVPIRENPCDVLVSRNGKPLSELPTRAVIGTGSLRRSAQLLHVRNDLEIRDIRGNVDTRLEKLAAGHFDAIVLALAGLRRLGNEDRVTETLPVDWMLPAVGQGALGIETRTDDLRTRNAVAVLNHPASHHAVLAERALLATLSGGCLAPIGAWARIVEPGELRIDAAVLAADGSQRLAECATGAASDASALGQQVATRLLAAGADRLITQSRASF